MPATPGQNEEARNEGQDPKDMDGLVGNVPATNPVVDTVVDVGLTPVQVAVGLHPLQFADGTLLIGVGWLRDTALSIDRYVLN